MASGFFCHTGVKLVVRENFHILQLWAPYKNSSCRSRMSSGSPVAKGGPQHHCSQPQPASHMAAWCSLERGKEGKQCADGVWKVSKTQVHKRGCIWSAQNTSLGIQWLLYKSWLSLLYIGSDGSAKRLWDLWQHTKSFPDSTGPVVMCCITALQPKQRGLGVENSSLNLGMWEFTHHYLAVCTNALQKITIFKLC